MFNEKFFDEEFYRRKTGTKGAKRDGQSPFYIEFANKFKSAFGSSVKTVLDIGCGMGWRTLNHIKNGYDATGCDISQWAFDNSVLPKGKHICSDMRDLRNHTQELFDVVIAERSIEYLPDEATHRSALSAITSLSKNKIVFAIICSDHKDKELVRRAAPGRLGIKPKAYWESLFFEFGLQVNKNQTDAMITGGWDCIWVVNKD